MNRYGPKFEVVNDQKWRQIERNEEYKRTRCMMVETEDGHKEVHGGM